MTRSIRSILQVSALALLPLLTPSKYAQAEWTGGLEAGTQLGSGKSPTLRFYARDNGDPLLHYVYLDWTRENAGHSYRLGYKPVFNVSRSLYSFGEFTVEEEADSIIERRLDALLGLGNHIHRSRDSLLTLEFGGGGQQLNFVGDREDQTEGFFYLGAQFYKVFFDTLRFNTFVDSRLGSLQDTVNAEIGVSIRLSATTALKYTYRYQRIDFDDGNLPTLVDKDNFFTLTYGF